ncbi:CCA tRNA nucleotidyltransferase [Alkalibacillus silvisoli]|uniref:CCA-adding enzyme n=1 Tax=Alkalibacillus silvisoli TaxID=392823 RepID=A0ABN0ZUT5_9BACI
MLGEPFIKAKNIINTFENHGFEAYFVGGSVRDYLLDIPIGDVDIATNAKPDEMLKLFKRTVPVGIEHGTVIIIDNGHDFEVTTYRTEGDYEDFRRPDSVEFVTDLKLDLSRRDFTINAMAMNMNGEVIDPYDGQSHLKERMIHTVGLAKDRFSEDALRMLRAIRFASQLDFNISNDVSAAIHQYKDLLSKIAVERIQAELFKMFKGAGVQRGLSSLEKTKLDQALPLFNYEPNLVSKLKAHVIDLIEYPSVVIAALTLLSDHHFFDDWIKTYKISNQIKKGAILLINSLNHYNQKGVNEELLYKLGESQFRPFIEIVHVMTGECLELKALTMQYEQLPIHSRGDLAISGHDIMSMFPNMSKGRWIGEYLEQVERLVLLKQISNNHKDIESEVKRWKELDIN